MCFDSLILLFLLPLPVVLLWKSEVILQAEKRAVLQKNTVPQLSAVNKKYFLAALWQFKLFFGAVGQWLHCLMCSSVVYICSGLHLLWFCLCCRWARGGGEPGIALRYPEHWLNLTLCACGAVCLTRTYLVWAMRMNQHPAWEQKKLCFSTRRDQRISSFNRMPSPLSPCLRSVKRHI